MMNRFIRSFQNSNKDDDHSDHHNSIYTSNNNASSSSQQQQQRLIPILKQLKNNVKQLTLLDNLPMMENHPERKITIVHMSDSHISHQFLKSVPNGDIFIHSGDISHKSEWYGLQDKMEKASPNIKKEDLYESAPSIISFNEWIAKLPHKIKIVISGNHEMGFNFLTREFIQQKVLNNVIYLQDEQLIINYKGKDLLKLYGTPWTTSSRMAFSMKRDLIKAKWEDIPLDTDILITHLPPYGIMDLASSNEPSHFCDYCKKEHRYRKHWGDVNLRNKAIELNDKGRLKAHLFGHVHEFHGTSIEPKTKDRKTPLLYSNAASVGSHTDPNIEQPVVIEMSLL